MTFFSETKLIIKEMNASSVLRMIDVRFNPNLSKLTNNNLKMIMMDY